MAESRTCRSFRWLNYWANEKEKQPRADAEKRSPTPRAMVCTRTFSAKALGRFCKFHARGLIKTGFKGVGTGEGRIAKLGHATRAGRLREGRERLPPRGKIARFCKRGRISAVVACFAPLTVGAAIANVPDVVAGRGRDDRRSTSDHRLPVGELRTASSGPPADSGFRKLAGNVEAGASCRSTISSPAVG